MGSNHFMKNISQATDTILPRWLTKPTELPRSKGSYVLVMQLAQDCSIEIGKLGVFHCPAGRYYYVGSAMGPGGLAGRVGRHFSEDKNKRLRWHIDYLRAKMRIQGCWVWETEHRVECDVASWFGSQVDVEFLAHIGSSDCRCQSHVYFKRSNGL